MGNLFDLTGKVALITGGSSGLGVQFAKALARAGADIVIAARRVEKLDGVKKEVEAIGVRCLALRCDVSSTDEIKDMVKATKEYFGRIDILVNNAGVGEAVPAELQSDEQWSKVMSINCDGAYFVAREVGKVMIEQKYGKIINIGSLHSMFAMKGNPLSAYCSSKGALLMLTKALSCEWAKYNITVNIIGPAYFPSEMTEDALANDGVLNTIETFCPMGRPGKDGELDGALIYFASDASSYTTGQYLAVDGGWSAI